MAPLPAREWSHDHAAHLLRRAAFGGPPAWIDELAALAPAAAVARLLAGTVGRTPHIGTPPPAPKPSELIEDGGVNRLRQWWLGRLSSPHHPAREKMALFWHGHFTTSARKVRRAVMLGRQLELLRAHALGNFQRLTGEIVLDPAMIRFLDAESSNRAHPNENLARELMELFTLGEGNYTENDVRELARALTGLRIENEDGPRPRVVLASDRQDDARKEILGQRGRFHRPSRFLRLIFSKDACAPFLCGRLWAYFCAAPPPRGAIDALSATLRRSNFDVQPVLRQLFLSRAFYAPAERGRQFKSPVQWFAQTMRGFNVETPPVKWGVQALRTLGQDLFEPPNVAGWPGGRAWITTRRLMDRYRLAGEMVAHLTESDPAIWSRILPPAARQDLPAASQRLSFLLFHHSLSADQRATLLEYHHRAGGDETGDRAIAETVRFLMATPEFQLC